MTLTEIIGSWVLDAERMNNSTALGVVVTPELWAGLVQEQATDAPVVAGLVVLTAASEVPAGGNFPTLDEMVEIPGPDRVCVYVGAAPSDSAFPLGLDPAMPVVFVPVPPDSLNDRATLEMYNRLRW